MINYKSWVQSQTESCKENNPQDKMFSTVVKCAETELKLNPSVGCMGKRRWWPHSNGGWSQGAPSAQRNPPAWPGAQLVRHMGLGRDGGSNLTWNAAAGDDGAVMRPCQALKLEILVSGNKSWSCPYFLPNIFLNISFTLLVPSASILVSV